MVCLKNVPRCNSANIIRYGHQTSSQRFLCKSCKRTFGYKQDSMVKGTNWSFDTWVIVLHYFCNHSTMLNIQDVLRDDYGLDYNIKTIFYNLHRIINVIDEIPMSVLSGDVIQIDETLFPECQKGRVKEIKDYKNGGTRKPRRYLEVKGSYSEYFAYVDTAIDNKGICACGYVGLGSVYPPTITTFYKNILEEDKNNEKILCSDGDNNYIYLSKLKKYNHYTRKSDYVSTIKGKTPEEIEKLYYEDKLDTFDNYKTYQPYNYVEFADLKRDKQLNLSSVNGLHSNIKEIFLVKKRNVSTKYLASYMAFYTYLKNYKIKHNIENITIANAREMLKDILSYTSKKASRKEIEKTKLEKPPIDNEEYDKFISYITDKNSKVSPLNEAKKSIKSITIREFLTMLPLQMLKRIVEMYGCIYYSKFNKEGCIAWLKNNGIDLNQLYTNVVANEFSINDNEKKTINNLVNKYTIKDTTN